MIFRRAITALGLLAAVNAMAATTNDPATAEIEGRELALQLLSQRPEKNFTNTGTLRIFGGKGKPVAVPVALHTFVTPTNWQTLYFTSGPNADHAASFTVTHAASQPNDYRVAILFQRRGPTNEFEFLAGEKSFVPFAGSDFWLADLGLEFFHWPSQRVIRKELKQGKLCAVLVSANPDPAGAYSRVVSWIGEESGGIFQAEAYDAKGKLLKEFEPKSVERVNGQYQPRELQIRNRQTGTRTRIEFNFDAR
ncbi:MAG: outer membrane lipoprotein-sorting protein [Pedosphaera sp.]|nr:outer membrane lipoprotein-sorting protein [Pedosphaera sp.]